MSGEQDFEIRMMPETLHWRAIHMFEDLERQVDTGVIAEAFDRRGWEEEIRSLLHRGWDAGYKQGVEDCRAGNLQERKGI